MECERGCVLICVRTRVSTLWCFLSPAMEVSLIYSSSPFHPCWPQNRSTSCEQIEINNVHFGASPTTYWWIQSICFNNNFPKNLLNLSKSFPVSCGLWRKNKLLFVGCEGICTRVSVCIHLKCYTVGFDHTFKFRAQQKNKTTINSLREKKCGIYEFT